MSRRRSKGATPPALQTVPSGLDPLKTTPAPMPRNPGAVNSPSAPWGVHSIPVLVAVDDAADRLGISERSMWRAISRGTIGVVRLGRIVRISPDELRRFIETETVRSRRKK